MRFFYCEFMHEFRYLFVREFSIWLIENKEWCHNNECKIVLKICSMSSHFKIHSAQILIYPTRNSFLLCFKISSIKSVLQKKTKRHIGKICRQLSKSKLSKCLSINPNKMAWKLFLNQTNFKSNSFESNKKKLFPWKS
jgi:hypothetical protein